MVNAKTLSDFIDNVIEPKAEEYKRKSDATDNIALKKWYQGQHDAYQIVSIELSNFICKETANYCMEVINELTNK